MIKDQTLDHGTSATPELHVSFEGHQNLKVITKWTYFLANLGFILLGLLAFASIIFGIIFLIRAGLPGVLLLIFYLALIAVYIFPFIYLYRFSVATKKALDLNDQTALEEGLSNLKSHYKYVGIMTIVFLVLGLLMMFILPSIMAILAATMG